MVSQQARRPDESLKVAVLGCGSVGSQVVRLLGEQAGDLAARVGAPVELVGVAVRRLDAPREVEVPDGLLTTDAAALVARDDVDLVVEVIGGIEPARALILAALENGAVGRHRQQGAARRGRPDPLRGRREGRPRPLLRGRRRRRDPDPAPAARVAGRRPGHPGARHRQRHHQLHPRQDGHLRRRLRRGARGGPGARVRRGRPDRRRRGLRRRRQGRDPGLARLPLPGHRRRRAPRGHLRGHRRRRPVGPGDGLRGQAARHLRAARDRGRAERGRGPRAPGDDPDVAPAGLGARGLQRGLRRVRGRRPADVLRPRRRRCADRVRRARRPGHGRPQPAGRHPRRRRVGVRRPRGAADGGDRHPLPRRHRRRRPRGRAGHGRDRLRRARRLDPDRPPGGPRRRRPARRRLARARPTPSSPRPSSTCAAWTSSARSPR